MMHFELIQEFKVVLVTYKNEEDLIKNEGTRVVTTYQFDLQTLKGSQAHNEWSNLSKIQTHPSLYICPFYLQE